MKVHFQIEYFTRWGENLRMVCCSGSGEYDMMNDGHGHWYANIDIDKPTGFTYRYQVVENGYVTRTEDGQPHSLPRSTAETMTVFDRWQADATPQRPVVLPFVKNGTGAFWKGAGTAIPVFSLRSEEDFGIGQFTDLKLLADWAAANGQSMIQTLPVNDTIMSRTWRDSYPYRANSTFALNPIYINLSLVGKLKDKKAAAAFEEKRIGLNSLAQIDFEAVLAAKWEYMEMLFAEHGEKCLASASFKKFYAKNASWLEPYVVFCYFRDKYGTPDYTLWKKDSAYDAAKVHKMCTPGSAQYNKVALHMFIQYHLDKQLSDVKKYCNSLGILLKGDIPIGISRTSVDAWVYPRLFNMDCQAGAPPDDFARDGQTWGFPTYNWEEMALDGYSWFVARFRRMADHFDAYRIDHLLGFFRIWEIPVQFRSGLMGRFNPAMPLTPDEIRAAGFPFDASVHAVSQDGKETDILFLEDTHKPGCYHPRISAFDTMAFSRLSNNDQEAFRRIHDDFYYRRHEQFWKESALSKLPALVEATGMLVCGEDLGMIPACVPQVMDSLRILSLEIQRMPKDPHVQVGIPSTYPYMSVCTASSHDMSGIRTWIEEEGPQNPDGSRPEATPERCRHLNGEHLASPSMLAVFPLQDWLAMDGELRYADASAERINVPANPDNYWRYRMHLTLERLLTENKFNRLVRDMISLSNR